MDLPLSILRPFLGARIVKTGIAVFLSLAIFHFVGPSYGAFAAVAAILAVQPSVTRAREVFVQQFLGNLVGGAVAAVLGHYWGASASAMALGVILTLGLCTSLGLSEAASLAVVAVIFIMERPEHDFLLYTLARVGTVAGGMLIGYLVNRFIKPPNYTGRLRQELRAAQEGIGEFCGHLLASLASPEHYLKEQIKGEAGRIQKHLETASYFLDLYHESNPADRNILPLEKTKGSLYVFVERITDIHKIILQMDGLRPGAELGAVANALKTVLEYEEIVLMAALSRAELPPSVASASQETLFKLEQLVQELVDERESRSRGLALHSILTNIRHMSWRMDSLVRVLKAPET